MKQLNLLRSERPCDTDIGDSLSLQASLSNNWMCDWEILQVISGCRHCRTTYSSYGKTSMNSVLKDTWIPRSAWKMSGLIELKHAPWWNDYSLTILQTSALSTMRQKNRGGNWVFAIRGVDTFTALPIMYFIMSHMACSEEVCIHCPNVLMTRGFFSNVT